MQHTKRDYGGLPNQIAVVLGIITDQRNRVYMALRNDPGTSEHAMWEFPGGKIKFGEDPEEALKREVYEETAFEFELVRLLPKIYQSVYQKDPDNPQNKLQVILLCYHCKYIKGELPSATREVIEGRFFEKNEIDFAKCLPYTKEIIEMIS